MQQIRESLSMQALGLLTLLTGPPTEASFRPNSRNSRKDQPTFRGIVYSEVGLDSPNSAGRPVARRVSTNEQE